MTAFVLALFQLFAYPITNAYATQVKKDVVVTVSYTLETPTSVCVFLYDYEDTDMTAPKGSHCWTPEKNSIHDFDVWEGARLDEGNFQVVVKYPRSPDVILYLMTKVNT